MEREVMIEEYYQFLKEKGFPCVAAKAALNKGQIKCMVSSDMSTTNGDREILQFIYEFVESYRSSFRPYHSAAILFDGPLTMSEDKFEELLWARLNSLTILDRRKFDHDHRVDPDPASNKFSFSLKEEAFFIIGLHPSSSRKARRFKYPTLVFNPHQEFEKLKRSGRYEDMKRVVRKRDTEFSGSVNPMLSDFGEAAEVFQYSGKQYESKWTCPLHHKAWKI